MSIFFEQPHAFTATTSLPSAPDIPLLRIRLLDEAFRIMDDLVQNSDAASSFTEIFTAEGIWKTPFATYSGHDELVRSGHLWTGLRDRKSMTHRVEKILACTSAEELMLLGRIRVEELDGKVRDVPFSAHVIIQVAVEDGPERICFFQGWSSSQ